MARKNNSRAIKTRQGNTTIAIVVDGETEKWYLEKMKEVECLNIKIKPELASKKSIDGQTEFVCERLEEEYDKVYWVLDADTIIREVKQKKGKIERLKNAIIKLKKQHKNLEVFINTPCLEFWFLLHFQNSSKFYRDCIDVEKLLNKKYISDYKKTEDFFKQKNNIYMKLKSNLETAIKNARKLGRADFDNLEMAKAEMYLLIEDLLKLKK
jgi:hypothetical protein